MAIAAFPTGLSEIIQTNMLERVFQDSLRARLTFRAIAEPVDFPNRIGETITRTRRGLKPAVVSPINPSANTNLDNGLTSTTAGAEQYTVQINMYGDTTDLNVVTEGVGIANQALYNQTVNAEQAARSLDTLARNTLFYGGLGGIGGYLGGNTYVTTALSAAAATIAVNDIGGFTAMLGAQGTATGGTVIPSTGMVVKVGSNTYTLASYAADSTNVSTTPGGVSGTLTFTGNVAATDATLGAAVVGSAAPAVVRPNGRASTYALVAPSGQYGQADYNPGDLLTMQALLSARATLRLNNVPPIAGFYHCYLDDSQLLGLFRDEDFKQLYRTQYKSAEYQEGQVFELLGIRFFPTNLSQIQASLGAGSIHRGIVCGAGALVEADYTSAKQEVLASIGAGAVDSIVSVVDKVVSVVRPPLDRLNQIIAQSWYWIGGFALPTDQTANTSVIPTATNAYLKRAVVIESLGVTQ